jgi:hypothetical protein
MGRKKVVGSYDGMVPWDLPQQLVEPLRGAERVGDPVVAVGVDDATMVMSKSNTTSGVPLLLLAAFR